MEPDDGLLPYRISGLIGLLLISSFPADAHAAETPPALLWSIPATTEHGRAKTSSMVVHDAENIYASGAFQGTQDFGGITLSSSPEAALEYFVGRWGSDGQAVWVNPIRGTNLRWSCSVAAAPNGGVLVLGAFLNQADFGDQTLTGPAGPEEKALFLARYGAAGELTDARVLATGRMFPGFDGLFDHRPAIQIAATSDGGAVMTGTFSSSMAVGSEVLTGGDASIFVVRCDTAGNLVWARVLDGGGGDAGVLVASQPNDHVMVSGRFNGEIDLGGTNFVGEGVFLARYDQIGNLVWGRQLPVTAIAVGDSEATYVTGRFRSMEELPALPGSPPPLPAYPDAGSFLAKLDAAGQTVWVRRTWGNPADTIGIGIARPAGGDVFWLSRFAAFAEVEGGGSFCARGLTALVARYRPDGTLVWAMDESDYSEYGPALQLAATEAGNVVLASFGRLLAGTAASDEESPVTIRRQPASYQVVHAGDDAKLDVVASGAEPKSFQWRCGEIAILGATNHALVLTNYQVEFSDPYCVVVSNRFGAVTSSWAGLVLAPAANLPGLLWGKQAGGYGGRSYEEGGRDVCADSSGAVYLAVDYSLIGHFENQTLAARGSANFALVKYGADGRLLWIQHSPGSGADGAFGVAAGGAGEVYLTGWWDSSRPDFFGDEGAAGASRFLTKYDASGKLLWARPTGGGAVVTDPAGGVFVIGENEAGDSLGHTNLPGSGMFAAKYDTAGQNLRLQHFPTARSGVGKPSVDKDGGLTVGGYFATNTIVGGVTLTNPGPGDGIFLARFDTTGRLDWLTQGSWTSMSPRIKLAADGSYGVFGVTDFKGSFELGGNQIASSDSLIGVLFRLGSLGQVEWIRPLQPLPDESLTPWTQVTGVVVDPAGNACIIGRFTGRLPLGTNLLQSTGQWSAFVARFDRLGNCHGARQISGWAAVSPWAVAVDPHGHVLIAGDFGTPLDEPGSTLVCGESVLVSRGFVDAFVAKLESSLPIIEVSAAGSELLISWAWAGPELVLESSETVFGSTWIVRDEPVTHKSRRHTVRLSKGNTSQFFRLR